MITELLFAAIALGVVAGLVARAVVRLRRHEQRHVLALQHLAATEIRRAGQRVAIAVVSATQPLEGPALAERTWRVG